MANIIPIRVMRVFDNGNGNWRVGHLCVEPGNFVSNHACVCRMGFLSNEWCKLLQLRSIRTTNQIQFVLLKLIRFYESSIRGIFYQEGWVKPCSRNNMNLCRLSARGDMAFFVCVFFFSEYRQCVSQIVILTICIHLVTSTFLGKSCCWMAFHVAEIRVCLRCTSSIYVHISLHKSRNY